MPNKRKSCLASTNSNAKRSSKNMILVRTIILLLTLVRLRLRLISSSSVTDSRIIVGKKSAQCRRGGGREGGGTRPTCTIATNSTWWLRSLNEGRRRRRGKLFNDFFSLISTISFERKQQRGLKGFHWDRDPCIGFANWMHISYDLIWMEPKQTKWERKNVLLHVSTPHISSHWFCRARRRQVFHVWFSQRHVHLHKMCILLFQRFPSDIEFMESISVVVQSFSSTAKCLRHVLFVLDVLVGLFHVCTYKYYFVLLNVECE